MNYLEKLKKLEATERLLENQILSYFVNRLSIQQMNRSILAYRKILSDEQSKPELKDLVLKRLRSLLERRANMESLVVISKLNRDNLLKIRKNLINKI